MISFIPAISATTTLASIGVWSGGWFISWWDTALMIMGILIGGIVLSAFFGALIGVIGKIFSGGYKHRTSTDMINEGLEGGFIARLKDERTNEYNKAFMKGYHGILSKGGGMYGEWGMPRDAIKKLRKDYYEEARREERVKENMYGEWTDKELKYVQNKIKR